MPNTSSSHTHSLFESAKQARERSYSPYSHAKVGAAIRLADGRVFSGCNIENSSYGGTVCAERVAVWSAVAAGDGPIVIAEVCVVTDADPAWPPCGMCRQVISEFAAPGLVIEAANLKGVQKKLKFTELLPFAFTPDYLLKK